MDWITKRFMSFFLQIFPVRESFAVKECVKKLHPLTRAAKTPRHIKKKHSHNLTPLRLIFNAGVSLRRFLPPYIDIKNNKAAEMQRQIKNNLSSLNWSFFLACVSLRSFFKYLHSSNRKTAALGAQWNNISFGEMKHLELKSNYVFAGVVPSGLFCHRTHTSIYIVAKVQGEVKAI
jgi:hypothetical protein